MTDTSLLEHSANPKARWIWSPRAGDMKPPPWKKMTTREVLRGPSRIASVSSGSVNFDSSIRCLLANLRHVLAVDGSRFCISRAFNPP
jgi:hypothetical protein